MGDIRVFILKGYPRLSETFIAQEILGLEQAGIKIHIVSLRHPTDKKRHLVHDEIHAPVTYLPEYLHQEPLRVLRGGLHALRNVSLWPLLKSWLQDFRADATRNRIRRLGQALVLSREMPAGAAALHAHFIHTPASVALYASILSGLGFSISAHAKDIWTTPDHELKKKLSLARFAVTCTRHGCDHLNSLAPPHRQVMLVYHGLDLNRFAGLVPPRSQRDGSTPETCVELLSVGRAVEKKGFDTLLQALALLPRALHWRWTHVGGGALADALKAQGAALGLEQRVMFKGAQDQPAVLALYRSSDIFALPCRIAGDGDRDGLPNVLVEAQSQGLVCVSTPVSAIPELIEDQATGLLVPADDAAALARALERLIRDPALRRTLGDAGARRVRSAFSHDKGIAQLRALFTPGAQPS